MLEKNITRAAYIIPIALALLMSRVALDVPGGPAQSNVLLLVYAGAACFSALLFVPVDPAFAASRFSKLWRRSALVVLVFVLAVLLDPQVRAEVAQIVPLASMLFLLMMVALMPILAVSGDAADARQVVFATSLSALAVSLDMDYLRTGWFYKNSVLGSLRYDYLPWFAYAIIFTIIILGFTAYLLRASLIRVSSQSDTRPLSHENNK
jgi:hypothetical protein